MLIRSAAAFLVFAPAVLSFFLIDSASAESKDWKIIIRVSDGSQYDYCIAGVNETATDGLDNAYDIPALLDNLNNEYIYSYFPHYDWNYAQAYYYQQDIRALPTPEAPQKKWLFEVVSNIQGNLTISWPDLQAKLPCHEALLIDLDATGDTVDMQLQATHTYENTLAGMPYRFRFQFTLADVDGDGIPDCQDAFQNDPDETGDCDNDGIGNNADNDDFQDCDNDGICNGDDNNDLQDCDNDGVCNEIDADDLQDCDNDGVCNEIDTDDLQDCDNDGICNDADKNDLQDCDNDGVCNEIDADDLRDCDSDGICNDADNDDPQDCDNDNVCNSVDPNDDNDAYNDDSDGCPCDPNDWRDCDNDGICDYLDVISDQDCDNDGICNSLDNDDSQDCDNDNICNNNDNEDLQDCDNDWICNNEDDVDADDWDNDDICNSIDTDDDNDGYDDTADAFPLDSNEWLDTDNDGTGNNADSDDDGDGYDDGADAFPLDTNEWLDTDNDGIGNNADTDDDNDSYDDDADPFPLDFDEYLDTDNDGIGNNTDSDDDGDGYDDAADAFPLDANEYLDTDNDGIGNNTDSDDDGDGYDDAADAFPLDASKWFNDDDTSDNDTNTTDESEPETSSSEDADSTPPGTPSNPATQPYRSGLVFAAPDSESSSSAPPASPPAPPGELTDIDDQLQTTTQPSPQAKGETESSSIYKRSGRTFETASTWKTSPAKETPAAATPRPGTKRDKKPIKAKHLHSDTETEGTIQKSSQAVATATGAEPLPEGSAADNVTGTRDGKPLPGPSPVTLRYTIDKRKSTVELSWQHTDDLKKTMEYDVYRKTTGLQFQKINKTPIKGTHYIDTLIETDKPTILSYKIKILAQGLEEEPALFSNEVEISLQPKNTLQDSIKKYKKIITDSIATVINAAKRILSFFW